MLLVQLVVRLAVDLDVRINEVIQRWAVLLRGQRDVAPSGELYTIRVNAAEKIVPLLLCFPGFGDVNGNPADLLRVELGPAIYS